MKVYLKTFGCRANQYDSETVRSMVERSGGEIVASPEEADMAVFNSCAVTAEAEVDLRKNIRRAARRRPALQSVVMGCAASLDKGAIASLPTVSNVIPGADFAAIAAAMGLSPESRPLSAAQSGTRALLRIQDGCDEHCTFCATTLARGTNRSRPASDIVAEAQRLAEHHPEIVLTGIHIGTYGRDIDSSLSQLVERLVTEVEGARFRLSSIEATEVDERLHELFSEPRRLVPHVHAPLQSGSNRLLKRMGRHWYSAESYAQAIGKLVKARPVFGLGADVIAGFPGETEKDHRATLDLVASLPFTYLHVFPYSLRPGTAAERLPGHLNGGVVDQRAREIREVGEKLARTYCGARNGGRADLIVVRGEAREGLTEDYLTVAIQANGTEPAPGRGQRFESVLSLNGDGRMVAVAA